MPADTFYIMVRSPIDDDIACSERLAERDVLVEQSLPIFASTLREFTTT